MTIHDLARITAKPSEQELEQIQARQKRLQEKANAIAKERIELNKKAAKLQKEQEEEEVIEVEEVEFEPFTDEDESEEEFEERVQEEMKFLRKHLTDERQGKTVQRFVQVYWDILTKRYPTKWKKNAAKAILKFLLKKYPQLMDEGI